MKISLALVSFALVTGLATSHQLHALSDEFIDFINSKQTLWRAGRNFHRNTSIKYIRRLTGTIKDDATYEDALAGTPPSYKYTVLPNQFDARRKWNLCRSLNDIRDQGACGSCWAVSTVSAMTDRLCIQSGGKENVHFSELDLMSCCMYCGSPCSGGILRMAWIYGLKKGIVSGGEFNSGEGCKPYTIPPCEHNMNHAGNKPQCGDSIPKTLCEQKCKKDFNKSYIKDRRRISLYYNHTDVNLIMRDIFEKGPVTASFLVYEDFLNYQSGIYRYVTGKKLGYHSIKLLGWGVEDRVQYWLAANSWNTDWGEKGFFKILRGENHLHLEDIAYAGLFKIKLKRY